MSFRISLQLYTVRDALAGDFLGGLAKVAEMGYSHVEFAGFGGCSAHQVARAMSSLGLLASGAHVPLSVLDDIQPVLDDLREIGCTEATLPSVPEDMRAAWVETATRLDECALKLAEHGIAFGYHNHAFEFEGGGYSILTGSTSHTNFQLDVYWAAKAGEDPVEWIHRLSGRIPSIHCKDMGEDGADIELGSGILNWQQILSAAKEAGVQTLVTEMDTPRMAPMQSARACLQGLTESFKSML